MNLTLTLAVECSLDEAGGHGTAPSRTELYSAHPEAKLKEPNDL